MSNALNESLQKDNQSILWKEIRVAVFSLLAVSILSVFVLTVKGGGAFWKPKSLYYALFDNVGSLKEGAPVRIAGIIAGRVKDVRFVKDHDRYVAQTILELEESFTAMIREDSKASVKAQGLMGDHYVEINIGGIQSPQLPERSTIKTEKQPDFDQLTGEAQLLMGKLSGLTDEMKVLVNNINEGKGTIGQLAQNNDLYARTVGLLEEMESLMAAIKKNPKKFFKFSVF